MTCKEVEQKLLSMDNGATLSPALSGHLDGCPRCRRLAETLASAEAELLLSAPSDPELVESVMAAIEELGLPEKPKHSLTGWLFGGGLLMAALVAVPQSDSFRFLLKSFLRARVDLSVTVVIGLGLVAYLAVFVIAHSDRLEGFVQELVGGSRR